MNDSNDSNKKARIELSHVKNPLLAAMQENSAMLEQVANELLDATGSDPVLVSIASRLCTGMSSQNNVLLTIINEGMKVNVVNTPADGKVDKIGPPVPPKPSQNGANLQVNQSKANSRKPLKQTPLGNSAGTWNEVTSKRNQKDHQNNGKDNRTHRTDSETVDEPPSAAATAADTFNHAVREAERSVVIFNLNLGQSPLLNPATISSKVTGALIQAAAKNADCRHGDPTAIAGEMVNDLLSQVKSMDLFGKSTRPCKDPKNPSLDGTFYTIPVKISFGNKQVAKQVNDILRKQYKVSTSIPYHKTLKKAMTMAHDKVSQANPGKQVLISLEASKKCLKPMVRDPPVRASRNGPANWVFTGSYIQLPQDALDPKIKDISSDFCLPTTPTFVPPPDHPSREHIPGQSHSGYSNRRLKIHPALQVTAVSTETDASSGDENGDADDGTSNKGETVSISTTETVEMDTNSSEVSNEESPAGPRPAV